MIACIYNALLWSMFITVASIQYEWLDMRINTGGAFLGLAFVMALVFMISADLRRLCNSFLTCTLSLAAVSSGLYYMLGAKGFTVIPASIVREGIMQPHMSFDKINLALLVIALGGWGVTLFTTLYEGREH